MRATANQMHGSMVAVALFNKLIYLSKKGVALSVSMLLWVVSTVLLCLQAVCRIFMLAALAVLPECFEILIALLYCLLFPMSLSLAPNGVPKACCVEHVT
jgi:hypothetical protein